MSLSTPQELIEQLKRGNVVLFCGAGISASEGGLPNGEQLAQELAQRAEILATADALLPEVAQAYELKMGHHSLIEHLVSRIDVSHYTSTRAHQLIAALPFTEIVTTNWDNLLEGELHRQRKPFVKVVQDSDMPYADEQKVLIVKLHGSIEQRDSIIITGDDYYNVLARLPEITNLVRTYFATKTILFLGFGLANEDFKRLYLEVVHRIGDHKRRAYAVQLDPDEQTAKYWEKKNVQIIATDAIQFLEVLADVARKGAEQDADKRGIQTGEARDNRTKLVAEDSTSLDHRQANEKSSTVIETSTLGHGLEGTNTGILRTGKRKVLLKKYKLLKHIGSGALGDVYLAEDMDLERKVAVKHLKPEYTTDEEALKRFQREARTIANLRHPNIAIVHGLEQEHGQFYIIMEYAEKGTLADLLEKEGHLPITLAIDLVIEICDALADVHKQGITHRDIKPGNILLIKSRDIITPKLSDFGLSSAPKGGSYLGTPAYASPEQLCGDPVDARSDIYSLGVVLYEMLIGKPPFTRTQDEIIRGQLEQVAPPLKNARKEILSSLEKVVLKALAGRPEDRYQTTQTMAEALKKARREELKKEERLSNYYTQAEQYMGAQEWPMAVKMLEDASALNPNYKDVPQRLSAARKQMTLEIAYEQGLTALNQGDLTEAEVRFQQVRDLDVTYRDVAEKLEEAKKQKDLRSRYTEARQLEGMGEWSEAIQKYAQIIAIDSGYEDVAQRLAQTGKSKQLQLLYNRASALFVEKKWQEAGEEFQKVLDLEALYEDAPSKVEEAKRHAHSQILYSEGMEHLKNGEWQRAIDNFVEIRRSDPGYEAVDARLAEAERQKRLQNLFDEGMGRRGRKDWQGAIEKFTQVLSENPGHDTAARLLEEAKQRQVQEKAKAKRNEGSLIKDWFSSQDPAVKAALIGAIATIFAALCAILGSILAPEVFRAMVGTNPTPTPTPTPTSISTPTLAAFTPTATPTSTPPPIETITPTPLPSPTHPPTVTPTITSSPTDTPIPPGPVLISPDDGVSFLEGQDVKLEWEWKGELSEDEFFQVRIRLEGQPFEKLDLTKVLYQFVPASRLRSVGAYEWQVAIVSLSGEEKNLSQKWWFKVE